MVNAISYLDMAAIMWTVVTVNDKQKIVTRYSMQKQMVNVINNTNACTMYLFQLSTYKSTKNKITTVQFHGWYKPNMVCSFMQ